MSDSVTAATLTPADNIIVDEAKGAFASFIASVKNAIADFMDKISAIINAIFGVAAI